MKFFQLILILFFSSVFCQKERFQIIFIDNPNFKGNENDNLVFAFNNMKHGASSPCIGLNENFVDIFGQKWNGYCELTKKGYLQMFKLGKIFQQRYKKILDLNNPNINKVKAYASQANKTLMSANALFYGVYVNQNSSFDEQITIPVRNYKKTSGIELIPIFYYTDISNCKGWKKIVDINRNNPSNGINGYIHKFMRAYKNVLKLFEKDPRMLNATNPLDKINLFCSSFISNYYDDRCPHIKIFKRLNYTEAHFFNIYYDCIEFNLHKSLHVDFGNEGLKVPAIVISELVSDMIYYMDSIVHGENEINSTTKFVSYTGHDSSLMALQLILEKAFLVPPKLMNYGSNQAFLLYKVSNNEKIIEKNYNVKYFYNDQLSAIIEYDEFRKKLLDAIKTDYYLEFFCESFRPIDYITLSLCSGIIIFFIAIVSTCCYHRSTFNKKVYMALKEPKEKKVKIGN